MFKNLINILRDFKNYFFPNKNPFGKKILASKDYYLAGWVKYREEDHAVDEIERPIPKVSPECNYVPSIESVTETRDKMGFTPHREHVYEVEGKSSSSQIKSDECEVYEFGPRMVCEVDTTEEFIGTVKNLNKKGMRSYRPVWMAGNSEPVAVHLKLSVFSKEEVEKIKKQLKKELGIKLIVKGTPGRPSKREQEYRKMKEITW